MIDLSKTIEALAESLCEQYLVSSTKDAEEALEVGFRQALRHIYTALADEAKESWERKLDEIWEQKARIGLISSTDVTALADAQSAERWMRRRAEKA